MNDLPLSVDSSAGAHVMPAVPYCPRHLRLLLDTIDGRRHLRELLPGLIAAAHAALHSPTTSPRFRDPRRCPACQQEDETETRAVHAAAELPPTSTGTLRIAARIVGRLGPEPRAIPALHMLLTSHRHRLRHLIAHDRPHVDELGRAVVAVCDADASLSQPDLILGDPQNPAPRRCSVCTAAAIDSRSLLAETAGHLIDHAHRHHREGELSLCRAHLRDLINHGQDQDQADDPALLTSIAQAQLAQLTPVLDWLDSGFGHPHTIRHAVAELTHARPCPACATHIEGQRHALVTLTSMTDFATQADGQEAAICLRHNTRISAEHPGRIALAAALREATALLHGLPAGHRLAVPSAADAYWAAPEAPPADHDPSQAPLRHALGLDGRIHHDTAGAADDANP